MNVVFLPLEYECQNLNIDSFSAECDGSDYGIFSNHRLMYRDGIICQFMSICRMITHFHSFIRYSFRVDVNVITL